MRLLLFAICALVFVPVAVQAAPATDPVLAQALQTCLANGIDTGIRALYTDRPGLAADMTAKVLTAANGLGTPIDSEIVAVQTISKRVTRFYVALYFTGSPVWIRIDRYENRDRSFFLPLKCSTNPDEILPGYITDFLR